MKIFKIIGRTLAILTAALVVVGITMAVSGSSTASGSGSRERGEFAQGQNLASANSSNTTQANAGDNVPPSNATGRRGRDGGGSGGFSSVGEVLKSLVVVGLIVAVVAPIAHFLRKRRVHSSLREQSPPMSTPSA